LYFIFEFFAAEKVDGATFLELNVDELRYVEFKIRVIRGSHSL